MASERGLGKGLGALLGDISLQSQEDGSVTLPISQVEPGLNQPRKAFDPEALSDLADSIRDKLENDLLYLYHEERTSGFNSNDYLKLFRHIRENQVFYRTYFKLGYDNNYKILVYDTELAKKHFQNRFIDYHIEFFKSGLTKIIKMWLQNGCQESPEEMFEIIKSEYQGREIFFQSPTDH